MLIKKFAWLILIYQSFLVSINLYFIIKSKNNRFYLFKYTKIYLFF